MVNLWEHIYQITIFLISLFVSSSLPLILSPSHPSSLSSFLPLILHPSLPSSLSSSVISYLPLSSLPSFLPLSSRKRGRSGKFNVAKNHQELKHRSTPLPLPSFENDTIPSEGSHSSVHVFGYNNGSVHIQQSGLTLYYSVHVFGYNNGRVYIQQSGLTL